MNVIYTVLQVYYRTIGETGQIYKWPTLVFFIPNY